MFTGIVEEVGVVRRVARRGGTSRIEIAARATMDGSELGASVAVSGACLTVVAKDADGFAFEIGPETLARTTLGRLEAGDRVNLERPLRLGGSLGGHLVLGHVDGVGTVDATTRVESTARVRVGFDAALDALMIPQGSVAIDGVSLTIAALGSGWLEVMLIPHTLGVTTLGRLTVGDRVNIEADVIGKYVVRSAALRDAR
ncbi:MAG: riboflavin synthase [Candidatus Rokubacteria bacterium]|nr:riboflavin synthase [Candidatus Rokubacteria bacterium]